MMEVTFKQDFPGGEGRAVGGVGPHELPLRRSLKGLAHYGMKGLAGMVRYGMKQAGDETGWG
jgi:hypothetical protein